MHIWDNELGSLGPGDDVSNILDWADAFLLHLQIYIFCRKSL